MELAEKAHLITSNIIRLLIFIAIISAMINSEWYVLFVSSLAFFLTFLPAIIGRNYKIDLPVEFELAIVIFIYAAISLGEVNGYYTLFWWWDIILHTSSGIALGFVGFIILHTLYTHKKIYASPFTIVLFSFCFAVALGTMWEIFEFAIDSLFSMNLQESGLIDTMWDLIVASAGALLTSVFGYIYMKGGKTRLFERLIIRFIRKNPRLFKKSIKKIDMLK